MLEEVNRQLRKGKVPFKEIQREAFRLRNNLAKLSREEKISSKSEKINKILAKANEELEKI